MNKRTDRQTNKTRSSSHIITLVESLMPCSGDEKNMNYFYSRFVNY
jgi:hypothetical protein